MSVNKSHFKHILSMFLIGVSAYFTMLKLAIFGINRVYMPRVISRNLKLEGYGQMVRGV